MAILEKSLRAYLLTKSTVTTAIGQHIYAGRVPQHKEPTTYVLIRRTGTQRTYNLETEDEFAEARLLVDVFSRGIGAERRVTDAAEILRQRLSGFSGTWGTGADAVRVWGCTLDFDGGLLNRNPPTDASDAWVAVYSQTLRVTYAQAAIVVYTPLVITTEYLDHGREDIAYSYTLAATGGLPPYTWSLSAGTLPTGLALSTAGVISGTPTTTVGAPYSLTFQVVDGDGETTTKVLTLNMIASGALASANWVWDDTDNATTLDGDNLVWAAEPAIANWTTSEDDNIITSEHNNLIWST
jgi:hypothetical protein